MGKLYHVPHVGEKDWSNRGTRNILIMKDMSDDLIEKQRKEEIETDFEEFI